MLAMADGRGLNEAHNLQVHSDSVRHHDGLARLQLDVGYTTLNLLGFCGGHAAGSASHPPHILATKVCILA